ncbi:MAG: hypothetical protein UU71_C0003G0036, partial [Parcubacteria group bacterium GW2011_GWB1_41_6]
ILINLFKTSIFILAEFNITSLFSLNSNAAVIIEDMTSRQMFSIFK